MQFCNAQQGVPCISALLIATASTGSFVPILDSLGPVRKPIPSGSSLIPPNYLAWWLLEYDLCEQGRAGREEITGIFSSSEGFQVAGTSPLHKPVAFQGSHGHWLDSPRGHSWLQGFSLGWWPFTRGLLCAIPGCGERVMAVTHHPILKTEVSCFITSRVWRREKLAHFKGLREGSTQLLQTQNELPPSGPSVEWQSLFLKCLATSSPNGTRRHRSVPLPRRARATSLIPEPALGLPKWPCLWARVIKSSVPTTWGPRQEDLQLSLPAPAPPPLAFS